MRVRKQPILIASLVTVGLLAASCSSSSGSSSSSTTSTKGSAAAAKLITKSQNAVQTAGSVHFVDVTKIGAKSETLTGDIGPTQAQETLTVSNQIVLEVRLVSSTVYIQTTSASVLQSALSLSATTAAASTGKWIQLSASDTPTSSIVQSLTLNSALSIYYPKSSAATTLPTKTIGNVTVIPVTSSSQPNKTTTETTTLFVAQSTSLPAAANLLAKSGKTTETKEAAFTQWGAPVSVTAPTGAVTYASLAG